MNQTPYRVNNTIVKGQGHSYQLNNKYDAKQLCRILNEYETTNNPKLEALLIQLKMDIEIVKDDIDKIKETLQC